MAVLNYHRDYLNAVTYPESANTDFENRLYRFLLGFGVPNTPALAIASCVPARMKGLKYHTPVHILSIFDWADENGIHLESWQQLSLWFHDVIYDVKAPPKRNEHQSAKFMELMLTDYIGMETINKASEAIKYTADHLESFVLSDEMALVLDLDICMFAWDRDRYAAATDAIAKEYLHVSSEEYAKGRTKFIKDFKGKGFIFRTRTMQKYEDQAFNNIDWEINNLKIGKIY